MFKESNSAMNYRRTIKELQAATNCSFYECRPAYRYAKGNLEIAIAYLKAKSFVNLSFDEQVEYFKREAD